MNISKEQLFEHFINISQDVLLTLDREGIVVFINQTGCDLLQDEAINIIGKNWFDHYFEKSLTKEVKEVFLELVRGNIEFVNHYENSIISKDNSHLLMSWSNKAIYDDDGNIMYIISSGKNITVERDYEERLTHANIALDSMINDN